MIRLYAGHDVLHLTQIERIRLNICGELADGSLQIAVVEELLCIHNWLTSKLSVS